MMMSEYLLDVVQGVGLMVADVVQRVVEDLPPMLHYSPRLAVAVDVGVDVDVAVDVDVDVAVDVSITKK